MDRIYSGVGMTKKFSSTPRGEDKGEGEITTLSIADCRLRIGKTKSNQQTAINN
jgi:hypothetical protein